jgi:anaerobic selenocysteine-containing dehydrogenase
MSTAAASKAPSFCGLCIARCGCIATVEHGRFTRLDPDPTHPTGQALCAKGRAAPELVYSKERLTRPLRRTRPKGEADPDWVEIFWDEALDATTAAMRRLAAAHGPQSVAFSQSSPSTTAIADSAPFVRRLMNARQVPLNLTVPAPRSATCQDARDPRCRPGVGGLISPTVSGQGSLRRHRRPVQQSRSAGLDRDAASTDAEFDSAAVLVLIEPVTGGTDDDAGGTDAQEHGVLFHG